MNPPQALISLLQKNSRVKEYFQFLQTKLKEDIDIEKRKVKSLEKENLKLKKLLKTNENLTINHSGNNNKPTNNNNNSKNDSGEFHESKKRIIRDIEENVDSDETNNKVENIDNSRIKFSELDEIIEKYPKLHDLKKCDKVINKRNELMKFENNEEFQSFDVLDPNIEKIIGIRLKKNANNKFIYFLIYNKKFEKVTKNIIGTIVGEIYDFQFLKLQLQDQANYLNLLILFYLSYNNFNECIQIFIQLVLGNCCCKKFVEDELVAVLRNNNLDICEYLVERQYTLTRLFLDNYLNKREVNLESYNEYNNINACVLNNDKILYETLFLAWNHKKFVIDDTLHLHKFNKRSIVAASVLLMKSGKLNNLNSIYEYLINDPKAMEKREELISVLFELYDLNPIFKLNHKTKFNNVNCLLRVINLKNRSDRYSKIQVQCASQGVHFIRGCFKFSDSDNTSRDVADFDRNNMRIDLAYPDNCYSYAYDVANALTKIDISKLIDLKWDVSLISNYDSKIENLLKTNRRNNSFVEMTSSEVACAISHISCWQMVLHGNDFFEEVGFVEEEQYASGACEVKYHAGERGLSRAYLFVEDDAILCDRFTTKMSDLLNELPKDFHYCSIGYSRPKAAQFQEFSPNLIVPEFLWYNTGYLLSLDGIKFLLKKRVTGPLDVYLGLMMRDSFNVFVDRKQSKEQRLFRCFAARSPLVSQSYSDKAGVKRKWTERDSDVTFSGYKIGQIDVRE